MSATIKSNKDKILSLSKMLGTRLGLYKFILPFLFYFTFFEMIQMHADTDQQAIWWTLKFVEGGLWLMLIYFFSELRSGILLYMAHIMWPI